jgi:phosphoribosylamine--glycine ligase
MKILVLGQGAREHAIIKSLIRTGTPAANIFAAPGNAGIADDAQTFATLDPNSPADVTAFAKEHAIDLVVIGPELVSWIALGLIGALTVYLSVSKRDVIRD